MSLVAGLLRPRLFPSKLSKLKAAEKYSGSTTKAKPYVHRAIKSKFLKISKMAFILIYLLLVYLCLYLGNQLT